VTRVPKTTFGGTGRLYRVASRYVKGQTYHTERPVDCNRGLTAMVSLDTARQFGMKPCRKCLG
jgi:hypothetical protein